MNTPKIKRQGSDLTSDDIIIRTINKDNTDYIDELRYKKIGKKYILDGIQKRYFCTNYENKDGKDKEKDKINKKKNKVNGGKQLKNYYTFVDGELYGKARGFYKSGKVKYQTFITYGKIEYVESWTSKGLYSKKYIENNLKLNEILGINKTILIEIDEKIY